MLQEDMSRQKSLESRRQRVLIEEKLVILANERYKSIKCFSLEVVRLSYSLNVNDGRLTSLNQICLSDQGDGNRYEAAASHSVNIK